LNGMMSVTSVGWKAFLPIRPERAFVETPVGVRDERCSAKLKNPSRDQNVI
jgi:hypothetical protein